MRVNYGMSVPQGKEPTHSITVSGAGVVQVSPYTNEIYVNKEPLAEAVRGALGSAPYVPVLGIDREFAAKVFLTIEFYGDMKPREEDKPDGTDTLEEA